MEEQKTTTADLTREERIEIEEKAIEALINMGVRFSVPLKITPARPPKRILWWNKHFPGHAILWRDKRIPKDWNVTEEELPDPEQKKLQTVYMRHFHIKPLYLGTIDAIRRLYLTIEYDEQSIQDQPIQETKKLFKYIDTMAEIAALAIINDPSIAAPKNPEVKQLKSFLKEHLIVAKLQKLSTMISSMMNAGGFTSSIRLVREIGTTKPKNPNPTRANLVE